MAWPSGAASSPHWILCGQAAVRLGPAGIIEALPGSWPGAHESVRVNHHCTSQAGPVSVEPVLNDVNVDAASQAGSP